MTYSLKIAWRYFFSKSQQTVINRINIFAFLMVVVATAALFIVLSAFAGLKDFGLSFTNSFDPDYEIVPVRGKYLTLSENTLSELESLPLIISVAQEVEEIIPEVVKDKKMPLMDGIDPDETYKTIDYEKIIAVLIEAVKDQQTQIDELKRKIK